MSNSNMVFSEKALEAMSSLAIDNTTTALPLSFDTAASTGTWSTGSSWPIFPGFSVTHINDGFSGQTKYKSEGEAQKATELFFPAMKAAIAVEAKSEVKKDEETIALYKEIGQDRVVKDLELLYARSAKINAAIESGYDKVVTKAQVKKYAEKLPTNKRLIIDELATYEKPIPKMSAIAVREAKRANVFDSFQVFHIEEVKDPIIFGRIKEDDSRYFFIAEWDEDIKVEDLIAM